VWRVDQTDPNFNTPLPDNKQKLKQFYTLLMKGLNTMQFLQKIGQAESAPPPWGLWTGLFTILAAFALIILGTTIGLLLFSTNTAFASVVGWSLAALGMIAFVRITRGRTVEDWRALGLAVIPPRLPILFLLAFATAILFDLISLIVTGQSLVLPELFVLFNLNTPTLTPIDNNFLVWGIAVLFMVVFQPIAEGLVFRGVAYPAFRAKLGAWPGFILTVILAGMFHFLAYSSAPDGRWVTGWYGLILPTLDALFFTGVRAVTGSTRASIVAHIAFGIFAILKAFLLATS
jgi:membrane protease YdiL (CAAX protease family)